jgi:hypothetical protein
MDTNAEPLAATSRRRKRAPDTPVAPEHSLRKRAAAVESWARTPDRRKRAMPGAKALLQKFIDQTDATLGEAERRRQGIELRRAYYLRLSAMASEKARRKRERRAAGGPA